MSRRSLDIQAVIMAGGSGTRFWPLSRRRTPKQFLPIVSSRSMIEETAGRILPVIPWRKIRTIADRGHTRTIRRLLPKLPPGNALVEPVGRNTAPSLILATAEIYRRNPRAVVVVLASDHLISDPARFRAKLLAAAETAAGRDCLVTFGIPPTYPSTGYGYIHYRKDRPFRSGGDRFFPVLKFKEKPKLAKARAFLRAGDYLWNSGMFVWRADVFAAQLKAAAPEYHAYWEKMLEALEAGSPAGMRRIFRDIPAKSIDYALMERAGNVVVVEGDFGWSDVGAWTSLFDVWGLDDAGNALKGRALTIDTRDTLCFNPGKLTALIGVRDLVIVETRDALLVCHKNQDQMVKRILDALAESGDLKFH